jgi:hypothetical protein
MIVSFLDNDQIIYYLIFFKLFVDRTDNKYTF